MKVLIQGDQAVERVYKEYQKFCEDKELRRIDDLRQRYLHDYASDMGGAYEKGIEIGETRKGSEVARNMKRKGYPTNEIMEMTGLSREEVERL